jgi:hypothetical protein
MIIVAKNKLKKKTRTSKSRACSATNLHLEHVDIELQPTILSEGRCVRVGRMVSSSVVLLMVGWFHWGQAMSRTKRRWPAVSYDNFRRI